MIRGATWPARTCVPSAAVVLSLVLSLVLSACGEPAVPPVAAPTISPNLTFTCADALFPVAALDNPLGAETAEDPAAVALRRFLRSTDKRAEDMPLNGYRVLSAGAERVVYATSRVDGGPLIAVDARLSNDRWAVVGIAPCVPELSMPGLHVGTWRLTVGAARPAPGATSFEARVTEMACTSGRTAEGRILPPLIIREPRRVLVVFGILPLTAPAIQTCQAAPPTPVVVELGQPLGPRELLDGGVFPPADPWSPDCCG